MAPAATPDGVIERAQSALAGVLGSPSVRERLQSQGLSVVASRPAEFRAQIQRETAMWAKVIREAGIKAE